MGEAFRKKMGVGIFSRQTAMCGHSRPEMCNKYSGGAAGGRSQRDTEWMRRTND